MGGVGAPRPEAQLVIVERLDAAVVGTLEVQTARAVALVFPAEQIIDGAADGELLHMAQMERVVQVEVGGAEGIEHGTLHAPAVPRPSPSARIVLATGFAL